MMLGPYEIDNVYCAECSKAMEQMPDECIDLTVTSPPYDRQREYKGFTFDFEPIAKQLYRVTKKGGVVVWIVNDMTKDGCESLTSFKQAIFFVEQCGFRLHDTMIYAKRNYVPLTHNRYEQAFEYMFVLSKGKPKTFNPIMIPTLHSGSKKNFGYDCATSDEKGSAMRSAKRRSKKEEMVIAVKSEKQKANIWYYKTGKNQTGDDKAFEHPAAFPEKLAYDHIISWSNPGDLILDPMCGSGTVPKMAIQAHRHYLGFDIAQEYVDLSKRRIAEVQMSLF
jgi:site-specific DNA-methyltransferase (adenine-specific)